MHFDYFEQTAWPLMNNQMAKTIITILRLVCKFGYEINIKSEINSHKVIVDSVIVLWLGS